MTNWNHFCIALFFVLNQERIFDHRIGSSEDRLLSRLKSPRKSSALAPMSSTYLNNNHSHAHLRNKIEGFVKNKLIANEARPSIYDFLAFLDRSSRNGMQNWEGPSLFAVYQ